MFSYTYVLKDNRPKNLETYVSGRYRMNFIKRPVVEKEEDSTPVIYERNIIEDRVQSAVKEKRSIGIQTLFRESSAQTMPTSIGEIEKDGTFLEILELKDFSYGNGLPVTMYEIELIEKAREKRAFNDALPPLSDEACFNLRSKLTQEQEVREWAQKEEEYKQANNLRLLKLQQLLEDREKDLEEKRLNHIDELKGKKDEEVEAHNIKSKKQRVKIIRSIEKMRDKFNKKDKYGRDIILEYASFGSKVYAPLTRDGRNPDRKSFKLEMQSDYLTTYEGLCDLETQISDTHLNTKVNVEEVKKNYNNGLKKYERIHMKCISDAFKSIENNENRKKKEEDDKNKKEQERINNQNNLKPKQEHKSEEVNILEDIILFQRLLRGRKEQNLMYEGKHKRAELIKELRSADHWKAASSNDQENALINNYVEKLTNGLIDAIQGENVSKTLDFLSKEMIRIREEQKISLIVNQAENERRKREAEEIGRRQAESIQRRREDILYKEILDVNQATMDSYINSLIAGTVNKVSKKQVMKEIEIKANKLNKIVDKIENQFIDDNVTIRDLVSSFIFPEINRKKLEDKIQLEEKRFIETAKTAIHTSILTAKNEIKK